jgi:Domain of unknown function (DUF4338)/Transposase Tn5 dimerisation domain/Transposase DNA-binding
VESIIPCASLSTPDTLAWLRARVGQQPALSRAGLAKDLCARLNLRDAMGRPREMACRKQLLTWQRRGEITLPEPRHKPPSRRPPGDIPVREDIGGTLAGLGAVSLIPVTGGTEASREWNAMMRAHHPQGDGPLCGAQIRYRIVSAKHGTLGGLSVSAAAWRLRARDVWLGWTDAERAKNLQGIVCNSRFLILPGVRVKHLASHVLGRLARQIGRDWRDRYGLDPWLMETCVALPRAGTCYRAANWTELGLTAGRGRQDRDNKPPTGPAGTSQKRVFVYPLAPATLKRLCPQRLCSGRPPATPPGWVHREFGGASLGDARLAARLLDLGAAFFARPQANIPQACGSTAAAKAAYRFFDNERVTMDAVLEPHHQATIERMRHQPVVLVAQDSTSLCYTMHPGMAGIGPIGNKLNGPRGIMVHGALAFTPAGLPLGVLDIETWRRDPAEFGKRKDCNQKPIEDKESFKWQRALVPIGQAAARCPNTRVVTLADREADIYEYLMDARGRGLDTVVRVREKPRSLDGEVLKLWPYMQARPKAGTIELTVPRSGKQPARKAMLSVSFATVTLAPPRNKSHLAPIKMTIVLAREDAPPSTASPAAVPSTAVPPAAVSPAAVPEPLEWMLLSTVAVADLADAVERIQWYACRWGIEVFHRILKSGCQIEDRQLGTADRLEACLAIDAVVAWRIHHLTYLGRVTPDLPCDTVFEDDMWKGVIVFRTRKPPPDKPPSLREMNRMIAGLGGFLGRKSDGEPGTQTLWRGLQRADDIAIAFRGFREAYTLPA